MSSLSPSCSEMCDIARNGRNGPVPGGCAVDVRPPELLALVLALVLVLAQLALLPWLPAAMFDSRLVLCGTECAATWTPPCDTHMAYVLKLLDHNK